jgi:hypothetical protein
MFLKQIGGPDHSLNETTRYAFPVIITDVLPDCMDSGWCVKLERRYKFTKPFLPFVYSHRGRASILKTCRKTGGVMKPTLNREASGRLWACAKGGDDSALRSLCPSPHPRQHPRPASSTSVTSTARQKQSRSIRPLTN